MCETQDRRSLGSPENGFQCLSLWLCELHRTAVLFHTKSLLGLGNDCSRRCIYISSVWEEVSSCSADVATYSPPSLCGAVFMPPCCGQLGAWAAVKPRLPLEANFHQLVPLWPYGQTLVSPANQPAAAWVGRALWLYFFSDTALQNSRTVIKRNVQTPNQSENPSGVNRKLQKSCFPHLISHRQLLCSWCNYSDKTMWHNSWLLSWYHCCWLKWQGNNFIRDLLFFFPWQPLAVFKHRSWYLS